MEKRHNNFDALRVSAAFLVILTHAFLIGENRLADPLALATGGQCDAGVMGVFMFFAISGYLVTASAEATRSTGRFLAKRALRVFPGLALCLAILTFALGPAVTSLPLGAYLHAPGSWGFLGHNLVLDIHHNKLPGVTFTAFPAGAIVDGPLWSLPCEVIMYLMVAALAALGWLRLWVIATLFAIGEIALAFDTASWNTAAGGALWLLPFFAAGMAFYKLRARAIFSWRLAALALAALVLSVPLKLFIPVFALCGSYLVLWLALAPRRVIPAARFGDVSYGLYIYGWPVEQLVTRALGGAAPWWEVLAPALPATLVLAALSWHLVEAPALRLKSISVAAAVRDIRV